MSTLSFGTDSLHIVTKDASSRIPISDILYIESNNRTITIHTPSGSYTCYEKLRTLEEHLPMLIRCHQSYLVSPSSIISYDNQELILQGITNRIPVSRQYQKKMREYLQQKTSGGTLIGISGTYANYYIQLQDDQTVLLGRDADVCDIIIQLPMVSRTHCTLTYHSDTHNYTIVDNSTNGTFIQHTTRLISNQEYILTPGTLLCFGDQTAVFQLQ